MKKYKRSEWVVGDPEQAQQVGCSKRDLLEGPRSRGRGSHQPILPLLHPHHTRSPCHCWKTPTGLASHQSLCCLYAGTSSRNRRGSGFSLPSAFPLPACASQDPAGRGKGSELPGPCTGRRPEGNRQEDPAGRGEEPGLGPWAALCCQVPVPPALL